MIDTAARRTAELRPSRAAALAVASLLAASAAGGACRTAAPPAPPGRPVAAATHPTLPDPLPPIALRPASLARGQLGLGLVVASPARIAGDLDALARKLGLPTPLGQLLLDAVASSSGTAGLPLPRAAMARLDAARPITAVGLIQAAGVPAGICVAVPFKDAAGARLTLAEIGLEESRRGGESARRLPSGGTVRAAVDDRTLFLSMVEGNIEVAGALARELADANAPAPPGGQAMLDLYPGALGPERGALFEQAMAKEIAQLGTQPAAAGQKPSSADMLSTVGGLLRLLTHLATETRAFRLTLAVDERAGFALRLEVQPVAASALAARVATPAPYVIDPALPQSDDRTIVAAWGSASTALDVFADIAGTSGTVGHALRDALRSFSAVLDGPGSCATSFTALPLRSYCAWRLKPGVKPAKVLSSYAALLETSHAWNAALLGQPAEHLKIRRGRDLLEIEEPIGLEDQPAARALRKAAFGGDTQLSALWIRNGKLLLAQGAKPREMLLRFGGAGGAVSPAPSPMLAATLARTRGSDALFFVDLPSLLLKVTPLADDPTMRQVGVMLSAIPGIATMRAPLTLTVRSHDALAFELALPTESLESVASVVKPFMGVMGRAGQ